MKNGVFYFGIIFSRFQDSEVFAQKLMTSQAVHMTVINKKIKNIVKNIGWVLFKLGSDDLHQVQPRSQGLSS